MSESSRSLAERLSFILRGGRDSTPQASAGGSPSLLDEQLEGGFCRFCSWRVFCCKVGLWTPLVSH